MSILRYNIIKSNKSKIRTILTIILIKKPKTLSTYWFIILSLHKLSSFVMWVCYHQNLVKFKKEIFFTISPFLMMTNHILLTLLLNESPPILYVSPFVLQMNILKILSTKQKHKNIYSFSPFWHHQKEERVK